MNAIQEQAYLQGIIAEEIKNPALKCIHSFGKWDDPTQTCHAIPVGSLTAVGASVGALLGVLVNRKASGLVLGAFLGVGAAMTGMFFFSR